MRLSDVELGAMDLAAHTGHAKLFADEMIRAVAEIRTYRAALAELADMRVAHLQTDVYVPTETRAQDYADAIDTCLAACGVEVDRG